MTTYARTRVERAVDYGDTNEKTTAQQTVVKPEDDVLGPFVPLSFPRNRPLMSSRDIERWFPQIHCWHRGVQTNRPESITTYSAKPQPGPISTRKPALEVHAVKVVGLCRVCQRLLCRHRPLNRRNVFHYQNIYSTQCQHNVTWSWAFRAHILYFGAGFIWGVVAMCRFAGRALMRFLTCRTDGPTHIFVDSTSAEGGRSLPVCLSVGQLAIL